MILTSPKQIQKRNLEKDLVALHMYTSFYGILFFWNIMKIIFVGGLFSLFKADTVNAH